MFKGGNLMDFKGRAKNWDTDSRMQRSKVIANTIKKLVGKKENASVLDYGCATGLIGFDLSDNFEKITLMDSEKEMIDVVNEKIKTYKTPNIFPILIDLTKENYAEEKFDIIYTSMALHHIIDTKSMIEKFYDLLKENGTLCIIELDKEDGSFHINNKDFNGHNGFEHKFMEDMLEKAGFSNIKSETFFQGNKIYEENVIPYSLFYTVGRKKINDC